MWKLSGRLFFSFLALLLLFSSACFAENPVTEAEIREWAQDKDREALTDTLVKVMQNLERVNQLWIEQRYDWTNTEKELRAEIANAKNSLTRAAESFELSLQEKTRSMTLINRGRNGWRTAALSAFGGIVGYAAGGTKGAGIGAAVGAAGGIVLWATD